MSVMKSILKTWLQTYILIRNYKVATKLISLRKINIANINGKTKSSTLDFEASEQLCVKR